MASSLKARFAAERGCPEGDVTVVERGGTSYEATGCGEAARYVCSSFSGGTGEARKCEESGAPRRPVAEKGSFPPPSSTDPEQAPK
jgi:hypothetical protein